jgi:hypothetical protein
LLYDAHPHFSSPTDDKKIWRYMSLPKLLSLLTTKTLYLTKCSRLKIDDPFEGTLPKTTVDLATASDDEILKVMPTVRDAAGSERKTTKEDATMLRSVIPTIKSALAQGMIIERTYVNCWYLADHESAAMWKLYASEGIAISSSVGKLKAVLYSHHEPIYFGKVYYINYNQEHINIGNLLNTILTKRKSYEHENELRIIICRDEGHSAEPGIVIPIQPHQLIEQIYVAPSSEDWILETIRNTLAGLGYTIPVSRSAQDEPSVW